MTDIYTQTKDEARRRKDEETRKTADNYRQLWSAEDDEIVLSHGVTWETTGYEELDDMRIAYLLGRTFSSVVQRRSVLRRLLSQGLTLEEIHLAERQEREHRNRALVWQAKVELQVCRSCFCFPHTADCEEA